MSDAALFWPERDASLRISIPVGAGRCTFFHRIADQIDVKGIVVNIIARRPKRQAAIMRALDSSDPRSLDHPSQRAAWLGLARAIGHAFADQDFDRLHDKRGKK